jgi:hypothetical protein
MNDETATAQLVASTNENPSSDPPMQAESGNGNEKIDPTTCDKVVMVEGTKGAPEAEDDKKGVNETGN